MVLRSYTQEHPSKPPYHCSKKRYHKSVQSLFTYIFVMCVCACLCVDVHVSENNFFKDIKELNILGTRHQRPLLRKASATTNQKAQIRQNRRPCHRYWVHQLPVQNLGENVLSKIDYRIFLITLLVFFFSGRTSFKKKFFFLNNLIEFCELPCFLWCHCRFLIWGHFCRQPANGPWNLGLLLPTPQPLCRAGSPGRQSWCPPTNRVRYSL